MVTIWEGKIMFIKQKDDHKLRSFVVFLALAAFLVFVTAMLIMLLNKDDDPKDSGNSSEITSQQPISEADAAQTISDAQTNYFDGDEQDRLVAKNNLRSIAKNQSVDAKQRIQAFDSLADQCYQEGSITCLREIEQDYNNAGLSAEYPQNLLIQLEEFNERYIDS